jgi:hypothetical protein
MTTDLTLDRIVPLHPELEAFREEEGIFDIPPCELDLYNGCTCYFKNPNGPNEEGAFKIICPQKLHFGEIGLRIVSENDKLNFGRVACVEDLNILTEQVQYD